MSETYPANSIGGERRSADEAAVGRAAGEWLGLAAAPTFAVMALLTATGGQPQWLCPAAHLGWPIGGMAPMYALMSAFHSGPWLRLVSSRRSSTR